MHCSRTGKLQVTGRAFSSDALSSSLHVPLPKGQPSIQVRGRVGFHNAQALPSFKTMGAFLRSHISELCADIVQSTSSNTTEPFACT